MQCSFSSCCRCDRKMYTNVGKEITVILIESEIKTSIFHQISVNKKFSEKFDFISKSIWWLWLDMDCKSLTVYILINLLQFLIFIHIFSLFSYVHKTWPFNISFSSYWENWKANVKLKVLKTQTEKRQFFLPIKGRSSNNIWPVVLLHNTTRNFWNLTNVIP